MEGSWRVAWLGHQGHYQEPSIKITATRRKPTARPRTATPPRAPEFSDTHLAAATHPPVSRTPHAARVSMDRSLFLRMTDLSLIRNEWSGAITGHRARLKPGLGVPAAEQQSASHQHGHGVGAEHRE